MSLRELIFGGIKGNKVLIGIICLTLKQSKIEKTDYSLMMRVTKGIWDHGNWGTEAMIKLIREQKQLKVIGSRPGLRFG